jgi:hypothetical protein
MQVCPISIFKRRLEVQLRLLELKLELLRLSKDSSRSSASTSSANADPVDASASMRANTSDDVEATSVPSTSSTSARRRDPNFRRHPNLFKELAQQIRVHRQAARDSTSMPEPAPTNHPGPPLYCTETHQGLHKVTPAHAERDLADDCDSPSRSECCSPRGTESNSRVHFCENPRNMSWSVEDADESIQYWTKDIHGDGEMQERIAHKFRQLRLRHLRTPEI